jgi:hypothetical protein
MSARSAEWGENPTQVGFPQFFLGTLNQFLPRTALGPGSTSDREAALRLDAGRPATAGLRSAAVWAAGSIRDATAIAAIRAYTPPTAIPYEAIRVYRVELTPFHAGPLVTIEEIRRRLAVGRSESIEALIREYWEPTGTWHIREVIAPSLTILEEVPATSERDVYVRRWVQYNLDRERAGAL